MRKLGYEILGKNSGNFRYANMDRALFLANLKPQIDRRQIANVFAPRCNLTTRIMRPGNEDNEIITPWLTRTVTEADGGFVAEPDVAVAIFNADCPVIILFDKWHGHLIMMHAGFRCLVPKDPGAPGIVQTALAYSKLNPFSLEAVIGFGAGPCCYGVNHIEELKHPEFKPFIGTVKNGPRTGQRSLDLYGLAKKQLLEYGVPENSITVRSTCTACAGRGKSSGEQFHSNIYEGKSAGRNLVLAWFSRNP